MGAPSPPRTLQGARGDADPFATGRSLPHRAVAAVAGGRHRAAIHEAASKPRRGAPNLWERRPRREPSRAPGGADPFATGRSLPHRPWLAAGTGRQSMEPPPSPAGARLWERRPRREPSRAPGGADPFATGRSLPRRPWPPRMSAGIAWQSMEPPSSPAGARLWERRPRREPSRARGGRPIRDREVAPTQAVAGVRHRAAIHGAAAKPRRGAPVGAASPPRTFQGAGGADPFATGRSLPHRPFGSCREPYSSSGMSMPSGTSPVGLSAFLVVSSP